MRRVVDQTGLNERLAQHTRRSGMLVGLSMAVVIVLSIGAFIWIFFRIDPLLTDFTGRTGASRASPVRVAASPHADQVPTPVATTAPLVAGLPPPPTAPALVVPSPTAAAPFVATHRIAASGQGVNLRAGPSTAAAQTTPLRPGTPLQYLDQEERADDLTWLKVQTERGDVGWVRSGDVTRVR